MSGKSNDPDKKEDLVITPGGPRPKDHVYPVGPGEAVHFDERGKPVVVPHKDVSPRTEERSTNMADTLVLTPGGYRPRSLVHGVGEGQAYARQVEAYKIYVDSPAKSPRSIIYELVVTMTLLDLFKTFLAALLAYAFARTGATFVNNYLKYKTRQNSRPY